MGEASKGKQMLELVAFSLVVMVGQSPRDTCETVDEAMHDLQLRLKHEMQYGRNIARAAEASARIHLLAVAYDCGCVS